MITYVFISNENMAEDLVVTDYIALESALVFHCSRNKLPQIQWIKTQMYYLDCFVFLFFFSALGLTRSKSRCLPTWLLPRGSEEAFSTLTQLVGRI